MMKRLIAGFLMTCQLACGAWRVQESAPQKASQLRITLADGRRLVVDHAEVAGDSLVGFTAPRPGYQSPPRVPVAFLMTDLRRIERNRVDAGRTTLALIGLGIAVGVVVALKNFQTTDPNH